MVNDDYFKIDKTNNLFYDFKLFKNSLIMLFEIYFHTIK